MKDVARVDILEKKFGIQLKNRNIVGRPDTVLKFKHWFVEFKNEIVIIWISSQRANDWADTTTAENLIISAIKRLLR